LRSGSAMKSVKKYIPLSNNLNKTTIKEMTSVWGYHAYWTV
jgi:hypothetical protein